MSQFGITAWPGGLGDPAKGCGGAGSGGQGVTLIPGRSLEPQVRKDPEVASGVSRHTCLNTASAQGSGVGKGGRLIQYPLNLDHPQR